ncbi:MAG: hypothetical protein E6H07_01925 [Bacteroidetes bacterium]|nr:MAG: hypothetical protein E6H07_01925 [Bacteroidota bacterium]
MLEQLFDLVKGAGKDTVVDNPEVPNEYNNDVIAEATNTVAGGLRNVIAGGGLENIIGLFQNKGQSNGNSGGLLKNPMVTMMIGHLISKLTGKYNLSPQSASNVATNLVPNVLNDLIQKTQDPNNSNFTLDKLIGSFTGGGDVAIPQQSNGFNFQDLISNFSGGGVKNGKENGGFDLQDIISKVTDGVRNNTGNQSADGGGLMDMIKGFIR